MQLLLSLLVDGLYERLCTRCIRWSLSVGGHEPQLFHRQGRFYLDTQHDFVIHAQAPSLARIKVVVLRIVSSDDDVADGQSVYSDGDSGKHRPSSAPSPAACAKVTASGVVVINISSIQQL